MRRYGLPFRVGHHFASEIVDYARAHDAHPSDFPYAEASAGDLRAYPREMDQPARPCR